MAAMKPRTGDGPMAGRGRNPFTDDLKSFIDHVDRSQHEAAFVGGLIRAAHALGLKVTAEGVERREQLQVLRELGCDTVQGYLIAKPRTVTDLPAAPVETAEAA